MFAHRSIFRLNLIWKCAFSLSFVIASAVCTNAQDIQYAQSTTDQHKRSSLTVDPSSLGMNLEIPLAGYAGRAGLSLPIGLQYSSKVWHMEYGGNAGLNPHANGWVYPVFEGGWTTTLAIPRLKPVDMSKTYTFEGLPSCLNCAPAPSSYTYVLNNIEVTMPDGSTHAMRKNDSAVLVDANHSYVTDGTYYAVDSSRMRLDYHLTNYNQPTILYLADGSRYVWTVDSNGFDVVTLVDRNGNSLIYSRNQNGQYQWTDTLGRLLSPPFPTGQSYPPNSPTVGDTTYTLPGSGSSSLTYILRWRQLSDARTDPSQPLRYEAAYNDCNLDTAVNHSPNLFGTGTSCDADDFYNQLFNPVLLSEIVLPNGKSYKFSYDVFGELDKIVYPTGGYERFQYETIPLMNYVRGYYAQANRGVVDHWISVDGSGTDENNHHRHYQVSYPNNTPPYIVTATAPDGSYTQRYIYSSQNSAPFGLEDVRVGRAYDERVYSASGQMVRRTLTDWTVTGPMSGGQASATRNPRVAKSVEIALDTGTGNALVKTAIPDYDLTYQFDVGVDQTSAAEYDWASLDQSTAQSGAISSMPLGNLMRTTQTTYLTSDANYRSRNILGLPTSTTVKDAAGTTVAQSSVSYDESSYPLLTYGSVTSWTDPGTNYRGNATTVSHWLNTNNSYLQAHAQFDQCGSVRNSWDAKGNQSQIEYSSSYAYAFPTLTRTPVPDPTGQNGSTASFISTSVFDFNTGLATSATDANNVTSNPEYNDPLLRPTRAVHASGNSAQTQSAIEYDDTNRTITDKSDLSSFNDNTLKGKTIADGIGRVIETRTYESDTNYIAVQTQYDSMGRAYRVSNPFRPLSNESPVWTTSVFDALGRVTSVTTEQDGAVVTSSYSGNTVTVTDQAGKKRRSVSDALGRLIRVDEPDANGNLDNQNGNPVQSTNYQYDALDNLTQVTQGNQPPRTFVYDSLKRLTSATNPESGTISYQYDSNGNLTQKTDARGVVSTYAYDALNRNISVTYTNDPANTPAVTRTYDNPANGANGLGRLWKTQRAGVSLVTINSYDALGKPTSQSEQFYVNGSWGTPFTVGAGYDKAGHITTLTYPSSNHAVTYNYDAAGRLADNSQGAAFAGNLGDGNPRTYAAETQYTARGAMQQEKFGTTDVSLYHKLHYNVRGQLYDVRVSTYSLQENEFDWNRGCLAFYYGGYEWGQSGPANNGNVTASLHNIPADASYSNFFYTYDNYGYDSLNRLSSVSEGHGTASGYTAGDFTQAYGYDRWGNRTIDQANTSTNIPHTPFGVDVNTNRLTVPSGQSGSMIFDPAGNLTTDTYSAAAVTRVYDAENRMTSETQANSYLAGSYTYDGDGRRVKRRVAVSGQQSPVETWQIYGFGGELIAEYAANAAPEHPQKEYGYRNGELLVTAEAPPPPPTFNGYSYRRTITIDHTKVPNTNQSNFPVLVSGTYSYLKTAANGGNVQNANGYDVIFTSDSGCATKLNHEVETYNATTGAVNYWVNVPTLSHASDTTIFMCYGNSSVNTDPSHPTEVWDANYKGVWHLPNGSSLNATDSTSNGNNGTATSVAATTGQVDGSGSFNGTSSRISAGNPASLDGFTAFTVSAWIKASSLPLAARIFEKWGAYLRSGARPTIARGS